MNAQELATASSTAAGRWIDSVARRWVQLAAGNGPTYLTERLEEEWLADLEQRSGRAARLSHALGCLWAAAVMHDDHCPARAVASSLPPRNLTMATLPHRVPRLRPRHGGAAAPSPVLCDINITPLIDVMLVLLVTLIISLPVMTHAVKIDLPQAPPSTEAPRPEVVNLDIEFDGRAVWNGAMLTDMRQLESYLGMAARQQPQPEIHLHPDPHVKYDFVAKVLASAQRHRMQKIGFVNTGEFRN